MAIDFDFNDWGSWGVGDYYKDTYEKLKAAIDNGEDFDTGWHGFKKEVQSMRVVRDNGEITVCVSAEMDDVFDQPDLIYDCLTEEEANRITDEQIETIRNLLCLTDFSTITIETATLPSSASLDSVLDAASKLVDECGACLHDWYKECKATTLYILYDGPDDSFIEERLKED